MNLLNNAADAAPADDVPQPIEIHSHWDGANFTLEIHDHGIGLNEEAELKAGSAFFTTKPEGHGLGLFLANATLERMGGLGTPVQPRARRRDHRNHFANNREASHDRTYRKKLPRYCWWTTT